jgi:hypothetical protein
MNAPILDLHHASTDLASLLALLVDPAATKQRLDELLEQEKATQERIDALNAMATETERLNTSAKAASIVNDNRRAALDEREAALDERQKNIESSEAARSDASLQRREAACSRREDAVAREEKRLVAVRTDLEAKHARIKDLSTNL